MAGIDANSPVAKNPVSASGCLEDLPVEGAFIRHPVPKPDSVGPERGLGLSIRAIDRQLAAMPCDRYLIRLATTDGETGTRRRWHTTAELR